MSKPQYKTRSEYYTFCESPQHPKPIRDQAKCYNCGHFDCLATKTLTKCGKVACGVCHACYDGSQWEWRERCFCYRRE